MKDVQRVFGGQVAGQALVAAGADRGCWRRRHHCTPISSGPGDPAVPLVYTVDRVRDGRSFTTRRELSDPARATIFTLSASFHHPEPGPTHSDAMPDAPPPDEIPRTIDRLEKLFGTLPAPSRDSPIDVRVIGPLTFEAERDPRCAARKTSCGCGSTGNCPMTRCCTRA